MSQESKKNKKLPCPVCGKPKKFTREHYRISHPDISFPEDIVEQPSQADSEQIPPITQITTEPQEQTNLENQINNDAQIKTQKVWPITWWKFTIGLVCGCVGIGGIIFYGMSMSMVAAVIAVGGLVPGFILIANAFSRKESGYIFIGDEERITGRENSIVINAVWNPQTKHAEPYKISFKYFTKEELAKYPGCRPHLMRNNGKHFYEFINVIGPDEDGKKLKPVWLPDKKLCSPAMFVYNSNMQPFKDYIQYNPAGNIQKLAAGALIIAMVVVGILMTMTSPAPGTGA